MRRLRDYLKNLLIAIDQLANALIGGWADETLSSHAHRRHPRLAKLIDTLALLFGDVDHCRQAYESERRRLQAPPETRQ